MARPTTLGDELGIALGNLSDAATGVFTPTLRLGVTGLSRAGKTIFITSLIHALLTNGRLPGFGPMAEGRFLGAQLSEHPDKGMPRFAYEQHLEALTGDKPFWPESTRRISQIRLTLQFQRTGWLSGMTGPSHLHLDIVDYPGEWLLDLPLLSLDYEEWSAEALNRAEKAKDNPRAQAFFEAAERTDASAEARDVDAEHLAASFTAYLQSSRQDEHALSALPPGRFLMPGDMEGSPALTFAPLPPIAGADAKSLHAMMRRRYDAYKAIVVRPFFRDHFARLDRQVVLVDALRAINAGPRAVRDLEAALTDVLACFRQGRSNPLTALVSKKIDRILFAATKADHLHHTSHDRLESVLSRLVSNASRRARFAGADTKTLAMASIRATREDTITEKGETLPVIIGTPQKGEKLGSTTYDGETEIAFFPGDLPKETDSLFQASADPAGVKFLRFNPPSPLATNPDGDPLLPAIRLDRALDFLIGDWLK